ncbi:MAG TPA: hypothetical protein PKD78_13350, partial [Saprospiraceae bacterium]|nr:hypothetical protein [Saprospiraceae bacterium]
MSSALHRLLVLLLCASALSRTWAQVPAAPAGVAAVGFEQHIDLRWQPNAEPQVTGYKVYRSTDGGGTFSFVK